MAGEQMDGAKDLQRLDAASWVQLARLVDGRFSFLEQADVKIELEATRMVEVWTVLFTVQPGGHGGWHTHPGPAVFTVSAGTLTMYEGGDPSCTPQLFPAGTGSIEADSPAHSHLLRNETNSVAQTIVTFIVPVGASIRTDLPDPGNCPF